MPYLTRLFVTSCCLAVASLASAATTHSLAEIRATAAAHVRASLGGDAAGDVRVEAQDLDPRLKLARCTRPLQAHLPYARRQSSQITVQVRCESEQAWSLYVPVRIEIFRLVAVASRPLPQGHRLTAADISMQRSDISRLAGGYLGEADAAVGQLSTRPLQLGQPLLSNFLRAPTIIRRGQTITVLARQNNFEVRSVAESLMDGAVGERVKVRNRLSRRVVEGIVASNGMVHVN